MALIAIGEAGKLWADLKAQWRIEAERAGDDFSTFATSTFAALDPIATPDPSKSGLYAYFEDDLPRAFCQVNRVLMSRFPSPVVRARFVTVSPLYDLGLLDVTAYSQVLVTLFSGVVWLARNPLASKFIRFHLRSPADAQYFAALQINAPLSPFAKFIIKGAWIECELKPAP